MPQVQSIQDDQFETEVLQSDIPVVVDFYADWCPPCKALAPVLDGLAKDYDGRIKFVKLNGDHQQEWARQLQVRGFPTLFFFVGGQAVGRHSGFVPRQPLAEALDKLLAD